MLCSVQSAKTRLGADCGSDHEFLIAKFRLKWKKVGKTTRPFLYDLNKIPYNYTVEMTNRFKGLDLIHRVPEELWTDFHDIVQEAGIKTIPKEKKCKKLGGIIRGKGHKDAVGRAAAQFGGAGLAGHLDGIVGKDRGGGAVLGGNAQHAGIAKLVLHTVPMERPPQQDSHRCCHERAAGCPPPLFAAWAATGF